MTLQSKNTDRVTAFAVPEDYVADGDEWDVAQSLEELVLQDRYEITEMGRQYLVDRRESKGLDTENPPADLVSVLEESMYSAERKAWDSLSRYKFQMFGYWAAIWVHLNRVGGFGLPSPWRGLVHYSRQHSSNDGQR